MVERATVENYLVNRFTIDKFKEFVGFDEDVVELMSFTGDNFVSARYFSCRFGFTDDISRSVRVSISLKNWPSSSNRLVFNCSDNWGGHIPGLGENIEVDVSSYRTAEEAVKDVIDIFCAKWRRPSSPGCVKAYLTSSKFMWVWKRPGSQSVAVVDGDNFLVETYDYRLYVYSDSTTNECVCVSHRELSSVNVGTHDTITTLNGSYFFKSALIPLYENSIPFDRIRTYIIRGAEDQFEHVVVDGEIRYVNIARPPKSNFLSTSIHRYTDRIEKLMPLEKLFLKGKADLYAKRPQDETPFLGFELEACTNKADGINNAGIAKKMKEHLPWLVMCKSDGSIMPDGFETVSVPATLDFWKESNLSSALDSMRLPPYNMRSFEHSSCGFHVHVSRSALSVLDLQKMERFIHNPNNRDFVVAIAGRGSNNYQKYNSDLFNNRNKWNHLGDGRSRDAIGRRRQRLIEGIQYLAGGVEQVRQVLLDQYAAPSQSDATMLTQRLSLFANWGQNYVAFSSLMDILENNSAFIELTERDINLRRAYGYGSFVGFLFEGMQSPYSRLGTINRFVGTSGEASERIEKFKELFIEVLMIICKTSPIFAGLVKSCFPEWDWTDIIVRNEGEESSETPSWKIGLLKSRAKYGRKNSSEASQIVKGPVGKSVNNRYDVLNTGNKNTVEFRLFKGTMNPSSVMRYLEFVDALVRFVAGTSATDDGVNYQTFIKWIRKDSFNVARYEHLVSFIIEKGFEERNSIRKRVLPKVVNEDKDIEGLVGLEPKGFEETSKPIPIGVFNSTNTETGTVITELTNGDETFDLDDVEEDFDYYYEEEEEEELCSDPNCEYCYGNGE